MKPTRSCVACKTKKDKNTFIRIVCNEDGKAILDIEQKENSRGIYFCKNIECIQKFLILLNKNKVKLKVNFDNSSLKELLNEVIVELGE